MVQLTNLLTAAAALIALALATDSASAHPGENHGHVETEAQVAHRKLFHASAHRSLKACANAPHFRKLKEHAIARRAAKAKQLRQEKQATATHNRRLDASTVLAQSHKSSLTGVTTSTDAATLFGSDPKCVLQPEVTEGPYYVKGELIRNDIRESQAGIDLYVELQVINVNTCTAVENLYVDFWHCNTTGVYAGVVASGNGNSADTTNIDKTFNRGLAPTDASGLVNFTTTFPGHYTGRATHIHVLGTHDGTVLANNTYSGGSVSHVGQLFFDQDLLTEVQATSTYAVNTQTVTTNAKDSILSQSAASGFDPVLEYALLGDSVEDGIFAWISIGVDMTISKSVSAAATLTSSGGAAATSGGTSTGGGGNAPGGMSTTSSNSGTSSTTSEGPVVRAASAVLVIGIAVVSALLLHSSRPRGAQAGAPNPRPRRSALLDPGDQHAQILSRGITSISGSATSKIVTKRPKPEADHFTNTRCTTPFHDSGSTPQSYTAPIEHLVAGERDEQHAGYLVKVEVVGTWEPRLRVHGDALARSTEARERPAS